MQALELVEDRTTQVPASQTARTTVTEARRRGLIVLTCGLHGNVVRLLPPLVVSDAELDRGLDILEEALLAAQPETNGGRS
jgi:4-aminobutyrate aminotransferase/(S)-3-amino-2-methylpropionate transaminase